MSDRPIRVQLSRRKGWRMPENTVRVARPGRWGNPFPVKGMHWVAVAMGFRADLAGRTACAVELHRRWLGLEGRDGPLANLPSTGGALEFDCGATITVEDQARGIAAVMAPIVSPDISLPATPTLDEIRRELRGKNLACWCPLDAPCHADVLLELANQPIDRSPK